MSSDDPYAPRPLSGLARGSHQLPDPPKKPTGTGRFTKDGQEIVLSYQTMHNAEKFVAENPNDNLEVKPHGTTDDGDKFYYVVKKMNETFEIAWELMKSEEKGDNVPTNPGLWSQAKSKARSKFKVYPSAYANGWAAKWYKSKGGGWKKKGKKGKKK